MVTGEKTRQQLLDELKAMRRRLAEFEKQQIESQRFEEASQQSQAELDTIFNNAPVIMFLVDRDRRIRKTNRAATDFTGRPAEEIIGLRGGEAICCLHALDDPKGCGYGPLCEACAVRSAVLDTFNTGDSHYQMEARLPSVHGEKQGELDVLVSTSLLNVMEIDMVLVCIEDITERKKAEEVQRKSQQRIRKLAAACIHAQEQEREVIAMEVHDRNLQTMLSIYQQIDTLESLVAPESRERQLAKSTLVLIKQAVAETRNITKDLYPETLAQFGLVSLVEEELRRFKKEMHCQGTLDVRCPQRLPKDIETTLYRVFHEALLNVKRHAREFSRVVVSLNSHGDYVEMLLEDDGSGFDIKTRVRRGVPGGMASMRRRIEIVGGTFNASSIPGRGTRIKVRVPLFSKSTDKERGKRQ